MSLNDLLKQDNDSHEQKKKALEDFKIAQQKKEQEFADSVKPCFDNIISPIIKETIASFNSNGHKAHFGQDVEKVTHLSSIATLSFSVVFRQCVMQLDITAIKAFQKVEFDFKFKSKFKLDNSISLTIQEITKEKIDSLIESSTKLMIQHCG